jgi:hypothetical protein
MMRNPSWSSTGTFPNGWRATCSGWRDSPLSKFTECGAGKCGYAAPVASVADLQVWSVANFVG